MLLLHPEKVPMGDIISSCVLDVDATIYDTIPGSGENFDNIESTPADSSTQAANDFFLGAAGTTDGDEPTFTGTAGDAAAYMLCDGGDLFRYQGTITTFFDGIHKTTGGSDFAIFLTFRYVTGANQILFTNRLAGGTNIGIIMFAVTANDILRCTQRGGTAAVNAVSTATMTNGSDIVIGVSHSHSGNTTRLWVESATSEEVAHTFNTTTAAASGVPTLAGYSGGTLQVPNTTRIYGCSVFNEYIDDTQAKAIIDQYSARHNRAYI